jgi:plasmid stabilization system protein ParE
LGAEFTAAVEQAVQRIAARPLAYQRVRGETRRAVLDRFPYSIYFRLVGDDVFVLAVHGRQHPRRWQIRQ